MVSARTRFERNLTSHIYHENKLNELKKRNYDDLRFGNLIQSEQRSKEQQTKSIILTKQAELEILDNQKQNELDKVLPSIRNQQEIISNELRKQNDEKLKEDKMRQQIRENSYELRELQSKLNEAYIAKTRMAQVAEKKAKKYNDILEDAAFAKKVESDIEEAEKLRRALEEKELINKEKRKKELHLQLEDQQCRRRVAYEESLKEKLMIDEIVRKIYNEDKLEREIEAAKKKAIAESIEYNRMRKKEWEEAEKKRLEDENRQIRAYMEEKEEKELQLALDRQYKAKAFEELQERLMKEREEKEFADRELEELRQIIAIGEEEKKARIESETAHQRKLDAQQDLRKARDEMLRMREEFKKKEAEEEERIRQKVLADFAESDRLEQLSKERQRQRKLDYQAAAERQIADRRERIRLAVAEEEQRREDERLRERVRQRIIEEERIRMIQQHADNVIGYLPKGVIKSEQDLEVLGDKFKAEYRKRPFTNSEGN